MLITLLGLAGCSALAAIACDWGQRRPAFYLLKPLTTALLIAVAVLGGSGPGLNLQTLLVAGLCLCLAGDVALLSSSTRGFIAGLLAFLLAHLAFAAGFSLGVLRFGWPWWAWLVPAYALAAGAVILPRSGRLRWAVMAYGLVLMAMVIAAIQRQQFNPGAAESAILAGSILFAISDTVLAVRRFLAPESRLQPLILGSYWLAIALIAIAVPVTAEQTRRIPNPEQDAEIANSALDELSGLVQAHSFAGFWAHNDGGDTRLFRLGPGGEDLGTVRVTGPSLSDWEDIAAYLGDDGYRYLLIADVGDNFGLRRSVGLHAIREPGEAELAAPVAWSLTLRYADGPRDVEAVAVDNLDRRILLLSKRDPYPRLYAIELPGHSGETRADLLTELRSIPSPSAEEIARSPWLGPYLSWPVAMDISPDGLRLLIVTLKSAHLWQRRIDQDWVDVLQGAPQILDLPRLRQIEGAAFYQQNRIAVGSEQLPAVLAIRPIPSP